MNQELKDQMERIANKLRNVLVEELKELPELYQADELTFNVLVGSPKVTGGPSIRVKLEPGGCYCSFGVSYGRRL